MKPFLGLSGKALSDQVATFKANSTGRRVMGNKMVKKMGRHPYLTAGGGMMAAGGIASGRQRSGLDKSRGRPTGIYGY